MAAGVDGDDLLAALADMEAAIDTRSVGAKRQARYRQRRAERNEASQSVTVTPKETVPQTPLKENPPLNGSPKGEPIPPQLLPEHVLETWNEVAERSGFPKARLTPARRKQ